MDSREHKTSIYKIGPRLSYSLHPRPWYDRYLLYFNTCLQLNVGNIRVSELCGSDVEKFNIFCEYRTVSKKGPFNVKQLCCDA
jgi:hypothetical protein